MTIQTRSDTPYREIWNNIPDPSHTCLYSEWVFKLLRSICEWSAHAILDNRNQITIMTLVVLCERGDISVFNLMHAIGMCCSFISMGYICDIHFDGFVQEESTTSGRRLLFRIDINQDEVDLFTLK